MKPVFPLLAFGVLALGCAPTEKTYLLRVKDSPGSTWQYTYSVRTNADPSKLPPDHWMRKIMKGRTEASVDGWAEMKVVDVKGGQTTFEYTATVTKAVGTGPWKSQGEEMMKNPKNTSRFTWDERMRNVNIDKPEGYADPLTNSFHTMLPKDPVKIGSKWTYVPFPTYTGDKEAKAEVKALEKIRGVDCLKIEILLPSVTKQEKNLFTCWINPENGRYLKVTTHSEANQEGCVTVNDFVQELKG